MKSKVNEFYEVGELANRYPDSTWGPSRCAASPGFYFIARRYLDDGTFFSLSFFADDTPAVASLFANC